MKKAISFIVLVFLLFNVSKKEVLAQASSCPDPSKGCVVCVYQDATQFCETGPAPGGNPAANSCATGATPPSSDLFSFCRSQPVSSCINQPLFIPCTTQTVPNGGYKCDTSATGAKSCSQCDYDPQTSIPDCTSGPPAPYTDSATCASACTTAVNPGACTSVNPKATCKTACSGTETSITGSCPSNVSSCCLPNGQIGNPGTGTQPVTSVNIQGNCSTNNIDTAIGCIPIGDTNTFAAFFLKWGLGIAGGIGTLFLVYASFMVMTSQGDPKRLQVGKELLMSAVSGIILLALSVFIFRILGITILGLF